MVGVMLPTCGGMALGFLALGARATSSIGALMGLINNGGREVGVTSLRNNCNKKHASHVPCVEGLPGLHGDSSAGSMRSRKKGILIELSRTAPRRSPDTRGRATKCGMDAIDSPCAEERHGTDSSLPLYALEDFLGSPDAIASVAEHFGSTSYGRLRPKDNQLRALAREDRQSTTFLEAREITGNYSDSEVKPGGGSRLRLENVANVEYVGVVGFGSPKQELRLVFDTGSADLWVAAATCATCATTGSSRFHKENSSTFAVVANNGEQVTVHYGQGEVAGTVVRDCVTLGYMKLQEQPFILVENQEGLEGAAFDGVVGLGWPSPTTSAGGIPILQRQGVYVGGPDAKSYVAIGSAGVPKNALHTFWWAPVTVPGMWAVRTEISLTRPAALLQNSSSKGEPHFTVDAVLDTGTSLLAVPASYYKEFVELLIPPTIRRFCWVDSQSRLIRCPCSATTYFSQISMRFSTADDTPDSGAAEVTNSTTSSNRSSNTATSGSARLTNGTANHGTFNNGTSSGERSTVDDGYSLPQGHPSRKLQSSAAGRRSVVLSPADLVFRVGQEGRSAEWIASLCDLAVVPGPSSLPWILGDVFLRRAETIFDASKEVPRIGIRARKHKLSMPSITEMAAAAGMAKEAKRPVLVSVNATTPLEGAPQRTISLAPEVDHDDHPAWNVFSPGILKLLALGTAMSFGAAYCCLKPVLMMQAEASKRRPPVVIEQVSEDYSALDF